MAAQLFGFDAAPRHVRRIDAADYATLAGHIASAQADDGQLWSVDFDPRWRSLLLLAHVDDPEADGPYYTERVLGPAAATASRKGVTVEVSVSPRSGPEAEIRVTSSGVPQAHGVRRACRSGPSHGHPVIAADFEVVVTGDGISLGDLHAAAQQAAARALATAGTAAIRADGAGNGEIPRFPEIETSVAEVALNVEELCHWPVADASEADRKQLGAFLAYQLSLMYGHSLDERMRRVPGTPAVPLRPFMAEVTERLVSYAADRGEAGEMVSGLIETWTAGWR